MDDLRFWNLIDHVDRNALRAGDEEAALAPLHAALIVLPPQQLEGFAETLAQKLHAIDGRRWADHAGESGGSDDGFLYARCFVVAMGKSRFDEVSIDPTKMPTSLDEWCEGILYLAASAFEETTGKAWAYRMTVSYESGSNKMHWPG